MELVSKHLGDDSRRVRRRDRSVTGDYLLETLRRGDSVCLGIGSSGLWSRRLIRNRDSRTVLSEPIRHERGVLRHRVEIPLRRESINRDCMD